MTALKALPVQEPAKPIEKPAPVKAARTPTGRPPGRPRGTTTVTQPAKTLRSQIGGLLVTCNMVAYFIPGGRNLAFDPVEIDALATAIETQAKTSARFKKYVDSALTVTAGGQLLGIVAIIGARRAARLGVFGPEVGPTVDAELGNLLVATTAAKTTAMPAGKNNDVAPDQSTT